MNSSINYNHSFHPLNGKSFNFTNGSYKTQNIPPQFQYNGFNSNDIEKDGYYNGNNFNINTENYLINYINIKRYLNKLNHMKNGINGMNGTNGINVTNLISPIVKASLNLWMQAPTKPNFDALVICARNTSIVPISFNVLKMPK